MRRHHLLAAHLGNDLSLRPTAPPVRHDLCARASTEASCIRETLTRGPCRHIVAVPLVSAPIASTCITQAMYVRAKVHAAPFSQRRCSRAKRVCAALLSNVHMVFRWLDGCRGCHTAVAERCIARSRIVSVGALTSVLMLMSRVLTRRVRRTRVAEFLTKVQRSNKLLLYYSGYASLHNEPLTPSAIVLELVHTALRCSTSPIAFSKSGLHVCVMA